jgi:hypothetical protein
MEEIIPDYLWTFEADEIDKQTLTSQCFSMERLLGTTFRLDPSTISLYGSFTTQLFKEYNFFTFSSPEILKLYGQLVKHLTPVLDPNKQYVLQAWVNIYRAGEFIDWHGHWASTLGAYHGFYCLNVGDSKTYYRLDKDKEKIYTVNDKDGLIVFGKSQGDQHKSSEWDQEEPRITIAFDVVPVESIKEQFVINHYLPFKT